MIAMEEKTFFIRTQMFGLLEKLSENAVATWGKMNAQQALEHLADIFDVSSGKLTFDLVTPAEYLSKYRDFLYSEKEFRENTKAPESLIGVEPVAPKATNIAASLQHLQKSVDDFFRYFELNPAEKTMHPVFGLLSFDEWILLHYKHVRHHLRQFALL